jgi:hypothetical protein
VAALAAHFLSRKMPDGRFVTKEGRNIHCYAIDPAAAMCARVSADCQGLISSLVHRNDIVPFLSDGALKDIKTYAAYLKDNRDHLGEILLKVPIMMTSFGHSKKADKYLDTFRSIATNEKLVPPGMVYVVVKEKGLHFGRVRGTAVARHFSQPRFVRGMMEHHFPLGIKRTLEKVGLNTYRPRKRIGLLCC